MVPIVPGRLERVNARQSQDATSKIRWSGFCFIEFSVDKFLIIGRCRRFPSVGLLMETREDDKIHNNLALTSCIPVLRVNGWLFKCANVLCIIGFSAVKHLYRAVQSLLCIVPKRFRKLWLRPSESIRTQWCACVCVAAVTAVSSSQLTFVWQKNIGGIYEGQYLPVC